MGLVSLRTCPRPNGRGLRGGPEGGFGDSNCAVLVKLTFWELKTAKHEFDVSCVGFAFADLCVAECCRVLQRDAVRCSACGRVDCYVCCKALLCVLQTATACSLMWNRLLRVALYVFVLYSVSFEGICCGHGSFADTYGSFADIFGRYIQLICNYLGLICGYSGLLRAYFLQENIAAMAPWT